MLVQKLSAVYKVHSTSLFFNGNYISDSFINQVKTLVIKFMNVGGGRVVDRAGVNISFRSLTLQPLETF